MKKALQKALAQSNDHKNPIIVAIVEKKNNQDNKKLQPLTKKPNSLPLATISTKNLPNTPSRVNSFPKTCHDLRCGGHTADGFYMVQSVHLENKIDTVYCEFNNSTTTGCSPGGITEVPTGGMLYNLCITECIRNVLFFHRQNYKQDSVTWI